MSEESQDKEDSMVIDVNEDGVTSASTTSSTRPQQQLQAGMSESSSESREQGESPQVQQDSSTMLKFMYTPESHGLGNPRHSGLATAVPAQSKEGKRTFSNTDNANTKESPSKEDSMVIDVNDDGVNSASTTSSTRTQQQLQVGMSDSSSESREQGESPHVQQNSNNVVKFLYTSESLGLGGLHYPGLALAIPAQLKEEKQTFSSTDNANTNRKTEADMKILTSYLKSAGENRAPEDIPPAILDKYLSTFFLGVKKYDGTEYEPCSLRAMLASIERYLRSKNYKVSLTRDVAFSGMRSHLKLKQMKLKGAKVDAVMCKQERLEKLYSSQKLGPFSPESVMFSLCFAICTYLKMKKLSEHKRLLWGDIILCKNGAGEEYLTFSNQFLTKANIITRYNFKHAKLKIPSEPRHPERDTVGIYKLYKEKRPPAYNYVNAPFYLSTASPGSSNLLGSWYRPIGLGVNKVNEFVRWSRELIGAVPSSRPTAVASATAAAPSSTLGREDGNSQLSSDGGRLSDHTSLIPIAMQQQLQQQHQASLQGEAMDSSEMMENGMPEYLQHQQQTEDFQQDEVHVIDSEDEEEDESFDDHSQVSAAYAEDLSSNGGVSAETSPVMYVQPCSPDYLPPQPAPEQPQPGWFLQLIPLVLKSEVI